MKRLVLIFGLLLAGYLAYAQNAAFPGSVTVASNLSANSLVVSNLSANSLVVSNAAIGQITAGRLAIAATWDHVGNAVQWANSNATRVGNIGRAFSMSTTYGGGSHFYKIMAVDRASNAIAMHIPTCVTNYVYNDIMFTVYRAGQTASDWTNLPRVGVQGYYMPLLAPVTNTVYATNAAIPYVILYDSSALYICVTNNWLGAGTNWAKINLTTSW